MSQESIFDRINSRSMVCRLFTSKTRFILRNMTWYTIDPFEIYVNCLITYNVKF